jgi:uncharacterized protein YcbK (DUF882 family)
MKYFTVNELTNSAIAKNKGFYNAPPEPVIKNLILLIENILDPIRELWGRPLKINSGYRCLELNRYVGSKDTSQHRTGQAADITTGSKEDNKTLFELIKSMKLPFDQLIDESNYDWIHISYDPSRNRKQILHL